MVKTNVKLKIAIWPQRRAHSVNVWIESPCWEPNTVVEKGVNTIKICHCIYTWSITTHHTQASKVFKLRKECWLLLACGWYAALGRVANFEMCHLLSLGMVAKLKNEGCQSGGTGFDFRLHYMLHMLSYVHQGGIHVPEKYFTYVTEHVAVVNMLHMLSYIHQGGRGVY
jgi:hypothetical protein